MQSPSDSPTFPSTLMPSRSSSTDSTDTIKAIKRETEGERDGEAIHRALSSDEFVRSTHKREKRDNTYDDKPTFSRSQPDPARSAQSLSSSTSRKGSKKVSPCPSLRPLSPTPSLSRSSSRISRRPQPVSSNTTYLPRSATAPSLTTPQRPSLTLSTTLLCPASTLPSPAPSPSRLCLATSPLLSANEASLQVSSIVVEGELENKSGNTHGEEGSGSGAKEMLEILRDKGTLIHDEYEGVESRDVYTQPFTLPIVERNPRLPSNLFDCTGTISLPDLPPTHPLPEEDEPMSMLPSPISPSTSQYRTFSQSNLPSVPPSRRSRPPSASASRKVSFSLSPSPTPSTPCSPSTSSNRLSSILKPGPPAPPTPSELAQHLRRADSATLLANSGFGLGKRRQISETVQSRETVEGGNGLGLNVGGEGTRRSAKKRPPLVSYTSFEDEFGLKPPRPFMTDEEGDGGFDYRDEGEGGDGGEGAEKKERKWWHLS